MAKACLGGYTSPEGPQEIDLSTEMVQKESEIFHCNQQQQQTNNSSLQEPREPQPRSKLGTSPNCNRHILGDIERKPPNNSVKNEDATNHIPVKEDSQVARNENDAGNRANSTSTINSSSKKSSSNNFRASSQQFLHKKSWKKQFKARHQKSNQKPQPHQQISKADMENIQNIKNQIKHHNKQQQHAQKNAKQIFNKKLLHRSAPFAIRSKFFLPDKRPRKEVIIPPTKFLLGGNISDPLNLNSLQDEALNATPTPTPKQSPITTPPKVEVIIPPNIHDPLHLLDPVDSVEYEKLLVSPMKRKSKSKHRNRKKKPKKRKRLGSSVCLEPPAVAAEGVPVTVLLPSTALTGAASASSIISKCSSNSAFSSETSTSIIDKVIGDSYTGEGNKPAEPQSSGLDSSNNNNNGGSITLCPASDTGQNSSCVGSTQKTNLDSAQKSTPGGGGTLAGRRNSDREKVSRDLRLDLASAMELQQQNASGSGAGRKRKISEGPNSVKNKFRRLDSMDKIVSPVIPQPGAWKRPPRTVPSGARKMSRVRSTSVSETDLISPTDETKTIESESVRGDTPDVESISKPDETTEMPLPIFDKKPKFRPEGAKYQYGNYNRYPGYRYLSEKMDVRLQVFQRNAQLFRGKDVLDIGCNVGHITIALAKDLAPKSILGIDIDKDLIYRARKNLSMYVRIPKDEETDVGTMPGPSNSSGKGNNASSTNQENKDDGEESSSKLMHKTEAPKAREGAAAIKAKKIHHRRKTLSKLREEDKTEFFPVSFPMSLGRIPNCVGGKVNPISPPSTSPAADNNSFKSEFPENVFFRTQNYVLPDEALLNNDTQQYDLILCLSVTKWIHLNFGDAGLKLAFKRMFNQLRPGGKLILEAQNWASYKKKKNLTETIYNNYRNIEFFPNKFHEYLLSNEVGFSHSYTLGVPRHVSKGFCRPIQLYAKGDFTPSHIRWSDTYYPQTPYEAYRGIYASMPRPPYNPWGCDSTPHGNSGSYSCRQTPMHQPTSQYYNPLETDSYLPSYDTEVLNRHYVFASPLYQTVWSPPASLRNSSSHTPVFGSVRDCDLEDGVCTARHVYPPNEECSSPQVSSGAFNSIREADSEDCSQDHQQRRHVYASCEGSSSPKADSFVESSPDAGRHQHHHHHQEHVESIEMDPGPGEDSGGGGGDTES